MHTRFDATDEEWAIISPLLLTQGRGPRHKNDRLVLNGVFYVLCTRGPWRDLSERYARARPFTIALSDGLSAAYGEIFLRPSRGTARMH